MKYFITFSFITSFLFSGDIKFYQDGEGKEWCPVSGQSLEKNYKKSATAKLKMNDRKRH